MNSELPRILVGVDFSPSSDRATDEARYLAAQMGAQLDLVHICPFPSAELAMPMDASVIERARKELEELEHRSRQDGFVAKAHLGVGAPVAGLLDFIRKLRPALVVVGSHGHGAVMRLLMGSVAENLIRHAGVPVVVVPAAEIRAHDAAAAR